MGGETDTEAWLTFSVGSQCSARLRGLCIIERRQRARAEAGNSTSTIPLESCMEPEERSPEPLSNEAAARVWSHLLHEDNMFMQRGNFFIVAQSMLIVAYSALLVQMPSASFSGRTVAAFGVLLAIVWLYVGHRHRRYLKHVDRRAQHYLREYAATQGGRPRSPLSTTALLAYVLPGLTVVVWVTFLSMG